ncbi:ATP-binding protein [Deinococcus malanensis]|uniref:ATP-binding protein n=1 Tax=Deinococcus malanensis TaxID=1706855 RepID=UPI0036409217
MSAITVPADTSQLAQLGAFVQQQCARAAQVVLVDLVVTELAGNAIRHGGARTLHLEVRDLVGEYEVILEDDGAPLTRPRPRCGQWGNCGRGYGLPLVQRCSKSVSYERVGERNQVRLVFDAGGSA